MGFRVLGEEQAPPGVTTPSDLRITRYHWTRDHLGSIREVTSATGALVGRWDYDPYGSPTRTAGAGNGYEPAFLWTGHLHHAASGLYLAPFRAYEPVLGRWISRDPIGMAGGINLYEYVEGDPVNAVDPLGLDKDGPNGEWNINHWYPPCTPKKELWKPIPPLSKPLPNPYIDSHPDDANKHYGFEMARWGIPWWGASAIGDLHEVVQVPMNPIMKRFWRVPANTGYQLGDTPLVVEGWNAYPDRPLPIPPFNAKGCPRNETWDRSPFTPQSR